MNQGQVIWGWVEYQVEYWVDYQILGEFLSKKVESLLEQGEIFLMGLSRLFIWLWPINGWKHEYLVPIRLDCYSPYSSK